MYLFNFLILLKLEYRTSLVVFTEDELNNLMSPFRRLFKNKLNFASSAPNSIVENSLIYKVRSLKDNQLQSKITNFFIQINDENILGRITYIRLMQIQEKLLLEKLILIEFPYNMLEIKKIAPRLQNSFIVRNLIEMRKKNFGIVINKNKQKEKNNFIEGDNVLIREILGKEKYIEKFKFLKRNKLIFLNQLTNLKGDKFIGDSFITKRKYFRINSRKVFLDYKDMISLRKIICENGSYELKSQYKRNLDDTSLRGLSLDIINDTNITQMGQRITLNFFFSIEKEKIMVGVLKDF
jgi:hypothetical protein